MRFLSEEDIIREVNTMANDYMEQCIMNYTSTDHQVAVVSALKACVKTLKELEPE